MNKKRKNVKILVSSEFYDKIEKERKDFMRKNQLQKLSTTAFTKVLANDKRKKRRH